MLEILERHLRSSKADYPYSILLPSWNNLEYLQLCIRSICMNSYYTAQIIVIVNEGADGTLEWVRRQAELDYIHAAENIGICYGLNSCRAMVKSDYIVYMNDDMYVLPDWDKVLFDEIKRLKTNAFFLSATMIEPIATGNPCVVVKDFGSDISGFKEDALLTACSALAREDWLGSTWPPSVVHINMWDLVGGLSVEFSPGLYSDPDFSKKLYEAGVRIFKGMGNSLVYHFGAKSTKRVEQNPGRKMFLLKWGVTARSFTRFGLLMGKEVTSGHLPPIAMNIANRMINLLKRIISCF